MGIHEGWYKNRRGEEQIDGLLAVHIRRGDFGEHCMSLAGWGSEYHGWLTFPAIVDKFKAPPDAGPNLTDPERLADIRRFYLPHCWPTNEEVVKKIQEVRRTSEGRNLRKVFLMTNGEPAYVQRLKQDILEMGGWDGVSESK